MRPKPLPHAEDVWWTWAVTATRDDLPAQVRVGFEERDVVLTIDNDQATLRMQRLYGGRAVVWGRVTFPATPVPHLFDGAPDWVGSDAVRNASGDAAPEFLAWFARDEWDSNTMDWWQSSRDLFDVLRSTHRGTVRRARAGEIDHPLLVAARRAAPVNSQAGVRRRLAAQVHNQMRECPEVDRGHTSQPMALVNWVRVARPAPFQVLVRVREGVVEPAAQPSWLPREHGDRLLAVLQQLHVEEAADDSGAWLLGRVAFDGLSITFQRAYDGLPAWFDAEPPDLTSLMWEMGQRTPRWRPGWVRLLPKLD